MTTENETVSETLEHALALCASRIQEIIDTAPGLCPGSPEQLGELVRIARELEGRAVYLAAKFPDDEPESGDGGDEELDFTIPKMLPCDGEKNAAALRAADNKDIGKAREHVRDAHAVLEMLAETVADDGRVLTVVKLIEKHVSKAWNRIDHAELEYTNLFMAYFAKAGDVPAKPEGVAA